MNYEDSEFYNFVIIGAGPAGLTTAISAARLGYRVLVLEKGEIAGPKPRGEGMGHYPIVDEILGNKFLPSIGLKSSGGRVWHSPGDLQQFTTFRTYDHYFFEWRTFIERFVEVVKEHNVKIIYQSEVIEPMEENGFTVGVKYKKPDGMIKQALGHAIIDSSGYSGVIGSKYGINYNDMNCPIVKCLISNANLELKETPDLQFYFIGNGDLDYSPKFPPSVAYLFPLADQRAEVGLMLRMAQVPQMRTVEVPTEEGILNVWKQLKMSYPGFSKFFRNARIDYEEVTYLPNAKMIEQFVPNPGLILIGDAAGFVNPFGSSGLYYSMKMADIWVKMITRELHLLKEQDHLESKFIKQLWSSEKIGLFNNEFRNTEVYKEVDHMYNLIGAFEYKIFNRLRTSEKINKKWDYISSLLKQA